MHSERRMFRGAWLAALLAVLVGCSARSALAQSFSVTDVGVLTGGTNSRGYGVGPSTATVPGFFAGFSETASAEHATRWKDADGDGVVDAGELLDLGVLSSGDESHAAAANTAGSVVGYSNIAASGTSLRAFYFKDLDSDGAVDSGEMLNLGALATGVQSHATAINTSGQVAGYAEITDGGNVHAFLFTDDDADHEVDAGELLDLGTLGGDNSYATGINDYGDVVGYSQVAGGAYHAFVFIDADADGVVDAGEKIDLGTLGGTGSWATGINNFGEVVGYSQVTGDSEKHAFIFTYDWMWDLGTLGGTDSEGFAINDAGQIVGRAKKSGAATYYAFLYSDGVMYDLNILSGQTYLREATGIK